MKNPTILLASVAAPSLAGCGKSPNQRKAEFVKCSAFMLVLQMEEILGTNSWRQNDQTYTASKFQNQLVVASQTKVLG